MGLNLESAVHFFVWLGFNICDTLGWILDTVFLDIGLDIGHRILGFNICENGLAAINEYAGLLDT